MELNGTRALVTGGGAGIGRAIALAAARAGARVAVLDISAEAGARVAQEISGVGAEALALAGSVANAVEVERAVEQVERAFGGIDLLVNNAGIAAHRPTLELSDGEWDRAVAVNLNGVFYGARAAGRRMCAQGSGVILNMSSIYGVVAAPDRLAYCATKSAVAMMTKVLAIEWARLGVRVNAIAPGYVETDLVKELVEDGRLDLARLAARTPRGKLTTPEEIAELAVFLASPRAAAITGQVVRIDGGWTAYGYI
jgi:NAD(P)-dependent dehydrogenase (short-subunit alcohol dehydrogenase family)